MAEPSVVPDHPPTTVVEEPVRPTSPWWRSGVVYQIYPRSFADSDGDGVGDLPGIRSRLEYLRWLGVDALWLSPIYRSPMADFGYDVSDHCDIDPLFGTMHDFDALLRDAHDLGIRVLLDWVPNHTSDKHPWFVESRRSRCSRKRDWYIWREGSPDRPPNNWRAAFGGSAWAYDDRTDQWYLHLFLPQQPDLNWANPDVETAMHGVLRFWLDRGVDGFRADVVHLIGKDPALPDQPPELAERDLVSVHDHPGTHDLLKRVRKVLDDYPDDRMMVGEVNLESVERIAPYYGEGDQLNLVFNFSPLHAPWDAATWRDAIESVVVTLSRRRAWPTWVLSNHDVSRHRTRYGGSLQRARAAAVLLLTLPGTPFLYQGEELGLLDADVPADRRVDPGGRDPCRAPMPWSADPPHGWSGRPWLPWPPRPARHAVETQQEHATSILRLYRDLIAARRRSVALAVGDWTALDTPDGVVGYRRTAGHDQRTILVNFTDQPRRVEVDTTFVVDISSVRRGEGQPFTGQLPRDAAVVLR